MDIGTLTGSIDLEDDLTGKLLQVSGVVRMWGSKVSEQLKEGTEGWKTYGLAAGVAGAAVVASVAGIGAAIIALGSKGSVIQGVEDAFNKLAVQAGSTGEALLGGLSDGVKGTIDSMVLMQSTTRLLSSGVKLTEADMKVMGATAREMGKATGTDASTGLNTLSQALLTGQTRLLKRYGIQIDTIQAETDFAAKLGTTRDNLNQTGKLEAARIAMLEGMRNKLNTLGESQLTFKERLQQATVSIGNWFDELAKGVANSESVLRAFDNIRDAIVDAFGGTPQAALKTIIGWVDRFADAVADYGPMIIRTFVDILGWVKSLVTTVQHAWSLVPDWFKNIAKEAALAGGALFLTNQAMGALSGGSILSTAASFATITSGLRDFASVVIGLGPKIITQLHGMSLALQTFWSIGALARTSTLTAFFGGLGGVISGLGTVVAGFMASSAGLTILFTGLAAGVIALAGAFRDLFLVMMRGQSLWDHFFKQRSEQELDWLTRTVRGAIRAVGAEAILSSRHVDELQKKLQGPKAFIGPRLSQRTDIIEGGGIGSVVDEMPSASSMFTLGKVKELSEEQKFLNKLMGEDALKAAQQYEKALIKVGGAAKLTGDEQREFSKIFGDVITKYKALGPSGAAVVAHFEKLKFDFDAATMGTKNFNLAMHAIPPKLQATGDTMDVLTSSTVDFNAALIALPPTLNHVNEAVESSFIKKGPGLGRQLVNGLGQGILDSIDRIPEIISNAIIHGADWEDTGAAVATEIGAAIGGHLGGTIGGIFGPLGSKIGSTIGTALGSMIGGLVDKFTRSAGEDVMRRVGRDWGISITEEMGDTIAQEAKTLFGGSRQAAEIFNLGKLLEAGGGLTSANLDKMTGKLHDVFSMLDTGMFTAAQAASVLDENFGAFAEHFEDGLISQELREIVRLTKEAGIESKAVAAFLQAQAGRARGGLEGILSQSLRPAEGEGAEGLMPLSQEQFDRLTRLTTASFGASVAAGQPFLDALLEMKDSFGLLNDATQQFGFTQSAAFGDLSAISNFFSENEELGRSIQGTNDMLIALANSNLLTQQSFSDLGAIAVENYNAMIAGGLSNAQALVTQQETLQTLWELIQEGTFTVDDQTQALIDQAQEAGLVGEAHMDAQERATQAMEKAAAAMEHVGDVLSQVFGIAGDEAETFADRTVAAAQRAAEAMAAVGGGGMAIADPNVYSPSDIIPMATGGMGTVNRPTIFKAGEAGEEDFAFSGAGKSFEGFGGNSSALESEMRLLRSDMKAHERAMTRIVRDELLTTPRR